MTPSEPAASERHQPWYADAKTVPPTAESRATSYSERLPERPIEHSTVPDYREADYREVQVPEKRPFTPGLTGSSQFYAPPTRERAAYSPIPPDRHVRGWNDPEKPRRQGGFLRTLSLILVCSLISTVASWGVLQHNLKAKGITLSPTNVVLGAQVTSLPTADGVEAATHIPSVLAAQEIYKTAVNQVVCISTQIPSNGWSSGETEYGSGFIISEDGYILTNNHVIESAHLQGYPLTVMMRDGTSYKATVIGAEADNDVAVIKIDAKGLLPASFGSSAALEVGETIYAVGNPRLLDYTMTDGIISALDRRVTVDTRDTITISMFQISAAVNNGNSGGPVYNAGGEVVGIVSAKYMSSGTEGLGFAIPIDDAIEIATELIEKGYVSGKAQLGVNVYAVDARTAEYYNMSEGMFVKSVERGSCSEKAGILPGDIITKLGESIITSYDTLKNAKREYKAGDTTTITVFRNGQSLDLTITFDEETRASD